MEKETTFEIAFANELQVEQIENNPPKISGYAVKWDAVSEPLPLYGNKRFTFKKGSFDKVLASNPNVKGLKDHDFKQPLASTKDGSLVIKQDDIGVWIEMSVLPDVSYVKDLSLNVKGGRIEGMSPRFDTKTFNVQTIKVNGENVEQINHVDRLHEFSVVTVPAFSATTVTTSFSKEIEEKVEEQKEIIPKKTNTQISIYGSRMKYNNIKKLEEDRALAFSQLNELMEKTDITPEEKAKQDELGMKCDQLDEEIAQVRAAYKTSNNDSRVKIVQSNSAKRQYNFGKFLIDMINDQKPTGYELEMSHQLSDYMGIAPRRGGHWVPMGASKDSHYKFDGTDLSTAAGALARPFLAGEFTDLLRPELITTKLGVKELTGLKGTSVPIPRKTAGATVEYVAESTSATASIVTIDDFSLTPKTAAVKVRVSRQAIMHSALQLETIVKDDIIEAVSQEMNRALLSGNGSTEPLGILNTPDVDEFLSPSNNFPNDARRLERMVRENNALADNCKYVFSPASAEKYKSTAKFTGSTLPFLGDDGTMNGFGTVVTTLEMVDDTYSSRIPVVFANWKHMYLGLWSGMEIRVNPYADGGDVILECFLDYGYLCRYPGAFAICLYESSAFE